ncbi:hypothetical protein B0O99DRAFT_681620 [Bisporella sp. PMI_857]|nr:hypothetical protein B0O99DRAFT_681620 [Bisporella sp. PMI_857]
MDSFQEHARVWKLKLDERSKFKREDERLAAADAAECAEFAQEHERKANEWLRQENEWRSTWEAQRERKLRFVKAKHAAEHVALLEAHAKYIRRLQRRAENIAEIEQEMMEERLQQFRDKMHATHDHTHARREQRDRRIQKARAEEDLAIKEQIFVMLSEAAERPKSNTAVRRSESRSSRSRKSGTSKRTREDELSPEPARKRIASDGSVCRGSPEDWTEAASTNKAKSASSNQASSGSEESSTSLDLEIAAADSLEHQEQDQEQIAFRIKRMACHHTDDVQPAAWIHSPIIEALLVTSRGFLPVVSDKFIEEGHSMFDYVIPNTEMSVFWYSFKDGKNMLHIGDAIENNRVIEFRSQVELKAFLQCGADRFSWGAATEEDEWQDSYIFEWDEYDYEKICQNDYRDMCDIPFSRWERMWLPNCMRLQLILRRRSRYFIAFNQSQ